MLRPLRLTLVPLWLRFALILGFLVSLFLGFLWVGFPIRTDQLFSETRYGITWNPSYARYLGISSEQGLTAALEELKVEHVRFSVEWGSIEAKKGVFVWDDLDRHLDLLEKQGVPVTLAIGFKTPRWPECAHPDWTTPLSQEEREHALRAYLVKLIRHVRERSGIVSWQVENEPFFPFGICEPRRLKDIQTEFELVRALDPYEPFHRSIVVTDSGELGRWLPFSPVIDGIGFSVYRVTDNPILGVRTYDWLPPWWYARKVMLLRFFTGIRYYASELQMEPWVLRDLKTASLEEMFRTFSVDRMKVNHWEMDRLRIPQVDLWGAEWWYWMKEEKGITGYWEEAKNIFGREPS